MKDIFKRFGILFLFPLMCIFLSISIMLCSVPYWIITGKEFTKLLQPIVRKATKIYWGKK